MCNFCTVQIFSCAPWFQTLLIYILPPKWATTCHIYKNNTHNFNQAYCAWGQTLIFQDITYTHKNLKKCLIFLQGNLLWLQYNFYTFLKDAQNSHCRYPREQHLTQWLRSLWYPLMSWLLVPLRTVFTLGIQKQSDGARSGEYSMWLISTMSQYIIRCFTIMAEWAGTLFW